MQIDYIRRDTPEEISENGGAVGSTRQMTIEGSKLQITSDNNEGVFFSWTEDDA